LTAVPTSHPGGPAFQGQRVHPVHLAGLGSDPVEARMVEVGSGRPVVFLHGLVGLNDHWEDVVRRVMHRVRCILLEVPLLDLRDDHCSLDGVTALTTGFLRDHVSEPAILVGNSFGGHVALRVAIEAPDLVEGLVLAGSSGLMERSIVNDVQLRPTREWMVRKIGELFHNPEQHMRDTDVDRALQAVTDRGGARAMVRLSRSARRNHLGDRIGLIKAPTLLIWGKCDVVTPPEAANLFLEGIRGSRIAWLDECGHAPMIEKPQEFADTLLGFADELDVRRGGRPGH
jgi:2-hydroxy-6-oxonona-2,4-dienedioate hydrolase